MFKLTNYFMYTLYNLASAMDSRFNTVLRLDFTVYIPVGSRVLRWLPSCWDGMSFNNKGVVAKMRYPLGGNGEHFSDAFVQAF